MCNSWDITRLSMRFSAWRRQQVVNMNRPGFFGEFLVRQLWLPDHYLYWKHNRLFRFLPAICVLAIPTVFDDLAQTWWTRPWLGNSIDPYWVS